MDPVLRILGVNPPRFQPGDAVVFIDPVITHENNPTITYRPNMRTVYTVHDIALRKRKWHLQLVGDINYLFEEVHFAPAQLLPDAAVTELLAESLENVAV